MWSRAGDGTILDMASDNKRFPVERILSVADIATRPGATADQCAELLADDDAAVRYWAAVGLICRGDDAKSAEPALLKSLEDESPPVRFAAAEVLCNIDQSIRAVPVLVKGLNDQDVRVRLAAAISLVAVGDAARLALPQMQKVREAPAGGTYALYTKWALDYAVGRLKY